MTNIPYILNPTRLTGPIFDKELRVASRRRRNYLLRSAHVILLTFLLVSAWISILHTNYARGTARIAYLAQISQQLALVIVWAQFALTQLLALLMLSNAVSEEIASRTLGVLLTTPITALQIVLGKLLSRLLQLFLLIAVSLPLLAIIRVFGGIPWDYLVTSLAITTTAMIFNALLSLYLSIHCKRPYVVILIALFILAFLYAFVPLVAFWIMGNVMPDRHVANMISLSNPFFCLAKYTDAMMSARPGRWTWFLSWPMHCTIMLAASAFLLARAVRAVRHAALQQINGHCSPAHTPTAPSSDYAASPTTSRPLRQRRQSADLRAVQGCPLLWRERHRPCLRRRTVWIISTLAALILFGSYIAIEDESSLTYTDIQTAYAFVFLALGALVTAVLPATTITNEKEARSWPILLTTPLTPTNIICAKGLGALRRCLPVWIPFALHLVIFIAIGYIRPIALLLFAFIATGITLFLTGTGLYFSARFKKTTTAVIANLLLPLTLWLFSIPIVALIALAARNENFIKPLLKLHPFAHAGFVMEATVRSSFYLTFNWSDPLNGRKATSAILALAFFTFLYAATGFFAAYRAQARLRKDIF